MPYVEPAVPSDYRALQKVVDRDHLETVSESGVLCATATDPSQCVSATKLASLDILTDDLQHVVVTTYGDTVQHYTRRQIREFLGTNNTQENALLMVRFEGYRLGHGGNPCTDATVQALDDNYEVYALTTATNCVETITKRVLLQATPKFQSVNYETGVLEHEFKTPGGCPGR